MKHLYIDENPYYNGTYLLIFKTNEYGWGQLPGHMGILGARLLQIDYVDYLRYCRDYYGAKIIGKKNAVSYLVFTDKKLVEKLAAELDRRLEIILNQNNVPAD